MRISKLSLFAAAAATFLAGADLAAETLDGSYLFTTGERIEWYESNDRVQQITGAGAASATVRDITGSANVIIDKGATLVISAVSSSTFSGGFYGEGSIIKNGSGSLEIGGNPVSGYASSTFGEQVDYWPPTFATMGADMGGAHDHYVGSLGYGPGLAGTPWYWEDSGLSSPSGDYSLTAGRLESQNGNRLRFKYVTTCDVVCDDTSVFAYGQFSNSIGAVTGLANWAPRQLGNEEYAKTLQIVPGFYYQGTVEEINEIALASWLPGVKAEMYRWLNNVQRTFAQRLVDTYKLYAFNLDQQNELLDGWWARENVYPSAAADGHTHRETPTFGSISGTITINAGELVMAGLLNQWREFPDNNRDTEIPWSPDVALLGAITPKMVGVNNFVLNGSAHLSFRNGGMGVPSGLYNWRDGLPSTGASIGTLVLNYVRNLQTGIPDKSRINLVAEEPNPPKIEEIDSENPTVTRWISSIVVYDEPSNPNDPSTGRVRQKVYEYVPLILDGENVEVVSIRREVEAATGTEYDAEDILLYTNDQWQTELQVGITSTSGTGSSYRLMLYMDYGWEGSIGIITGQSNSKGVPGTGARLIKAGAGQFSILNKATFDGDIMVVGGKLILDPKVGTTSSGKELISEVSSINLVGASGGDESGARSAWLEPSALWWPPLPFQFVANPEHFANMEFKMGEAPTVEKTDYAQLVIKSDQTIHNLQVLFAENYGPTDSVSSLKSAILNAKNTNRTGEIYIAGAGQGTNIQITELVNTNGEEVSATSGLPLTDIKLKPHTLTIIQDYDGIYKGSINGDIASYVNSVTAELKVTTARNIALGYYKEENKSEPLAASTNVELAFNTQFGTPDVPNPWNNLSYDQREQILYQYHEYTYDSLADFYKFNYIVTTDKDNDGLPDSFTLNEAGEYVINVQSWNVQVDSATSKTIEDRFFAGTDFGTLILRGGTADSPAHFAMLPTQAHYLSNIILDSAYVSLLTNVQGLGYGTVEINTGVLSIVQETNGTLRATIIGGRAEAEAGGTNLPTLLFTTYGTITNQSGQAISIANGNAGTALVSRRQDQFYGNVIVEEGITLRLGAMTDDLGNPLPEEQVCDSFANVNSFTIRTGTSGLNRETTLEINSSNQRIKNLTGDAMSNIRIYNGLLVLNQQTSGTYSGKITGNGGLVKEGPGTFTIQGDVQSIASGFTGPTIVKAGELVLNNDNVINTSSALIVRANALVTLTHPQSVGSLFGEEGALIIVDSEFTIGFTDQRRNIRIRDDAATPLLNMEYLATRWDFYTARGINYTTTQNPPSPLWDAFNFLWDDALSVIYSDTLIVENNIRAPGDIGDIVSVLTRETLADSGVDTAGLYSYTSDPRVQAVREIAGTTVAFLVHPLVGLDPYAASELAYAGAFVGSADIIKIGVERTTLTGLSPEYYGTLIVKEGILRLHGDALNNATGIYLDTGTAVSPSNVGSYLELYARSFEELTCLPPITGTGDIHKVGAGEVTVAYARNTGSMVLEKGRLVFGVNGTLDEFYTADNPETTDVNERAYALATPTIANPDAVTALSNNSTLVINYTDAQTLTHIGPITGTNGVLPWQLVYNPALTPFEKINDNTVSRVVNYYGGTTTAQSDIPRFTFSQHALTAEEANAGDLRNPRVSVGGYGGLEKAGSGTVVLAAPVAYGHREVLTDRAPSSIPADTIILPASIKIASTNYITLPNLDYTTVRYDARVGEVRWGTNATVDSGTLRFTKTVTVKFPEGATLNAGLGTVTWANAADADAPISYRSEFLNNFRTDDAGTVLADVGVSSLGTVGVYLNTTTTVSIEYPPLTDTVTATAAGNLVVTNLNYYLPLGTEAAWSIGAGTSTTLTSDAGRDASRNEIRFPLGSTYDVVSNTIYYPNLNDPTLTPVNAYSPRYITSIRAVGNYIYATVPGTVTSLNYTYTDSTGRETNVTLLEVTPADALLPEGTLAFSDFGGNAQTNQIRFPRGWRYNGVTGKVEAPDGLNSYTPLYVENVVEIQVSSGEIYVFADVPGLLVRRDDGRLLAISDTVTPTTAGSVLRSNGIVINPYGVRATTQAGVITRNENWQRIWSDGVILENTVVKRFYPTSDTDETEWANVKLRWTNVRGVNNDVLDEDGLGTPIAIDGVAPVKVAYIERVDENGIPYEEVIWRGVQDERDGVPVIRLIELEGNAVSDIYVRKLDADAGDTLARWEAYGSVNYFLDGEAWLRDVDYTGVSQSDLSVITDETGAVRLVSNGFTTVLQGRLVIEGLSNTRVETPETTSTAYEAPRWSIPGVIGALVGENVRSVTRSLVWNTELGAYEFTTEPSPGEVGQVGYRITSKHTGNLPFTTEYEYTAPLNADTQVNNRSYLAGTNPVAVQTYSSNLEIVAGATLAVNTSNAFTATDGVKHESVFGGQIYGAGTLELTTEAYQLVTGATKTLVQTGDTTTWSAWSAEQTVSNDTLAGWDTKLIFKTAQPDFTGVLKVVRGAVELAAPHVFLNTERVELGNDTVLTLAPQAAGAPANNQIFHFLSGETSSAIDLNEQTLFLEVPLNNGETRIYKGYIVGGGTLVNTGNGSLTVSRPSESIPDFLTDATGEVILDAAGDPIKNTIDLNPNSAEVSRYYVGVTATLTKINYDRNYDVLETAYRQTGDWAISRTDISVDTVEFDGKIALGFWRNGDYGVREFVPLNADYAITTKTLYDPVTKTNYAKYVVTYTPSITATELLHSPATVSEAVATSLLTDEAIANRFWLYTQLPDVDRMPGDIAAVAVSEGVFSVSPKSLLHLVTEQDQRDYADAIIASRGLLQTLVVRNEINNLDAVLADASAFSSYEQRLKIAAEFAKYYFDDRWAAVEKLLTTEWNWGYASVTVSSGAELGFYAGIRSDGQQEDQYYGGSITAEPGCTISKSGAGVVRLYGDGTIFAENDAKPFYVTEGRLIVDDTRLPKIDLTTDGRVPGAFIQTGGIYHINLTGNVGGGGALKVSAVVSLNSVTDAPVQPGDTDENGNPVFFIDGKPYTRDAAGNAIPFSHHGSFAVSGTFRKSTTGEYLYDSAGNKLRSVLKFGDSTDMPEDYSPKMVGYSGLTEVIGAVEVQFDATTFADKPAVLVGGLSGDALVPNVSSDVLRAITGLDASGNPIFSVREEELARPRLRLGSTEDGSDAQFNSIRTLVLIQNLDGEFYGDILGASTGPLDINDPKIPSDWNTDIPYYGYGSGLVIAGPKKFTYLGTDLAGTYGAFPEGREGTPSNGEGVGNITVDGKYVYTYDLEVKKGGVLHVSQEEYNQYLADGKVVRHSDGTETVSVTETYTGGILQVGAENRHAIDVINGGTLIIANYELVNDPFTGFDKPVIDTTGREVVYKGVITNSVGDFNIEVLAGAGIITWDIASFATLSRTANFAVDSGTLRFNTQNVAEDVLGSFHARSVTIGESATFEINVSDVTSIATAAASLNATASDGVTSLIKGNGLLRKTGPGTLSINGLVGDNRGLGGTPNLVSIEVAEAKVRGNFQVAGGLVVKSGASLAPGNSIGEIAVERDFILETGATLEIEISTDAAGNVTYDRLYIGSSLTFGEAALVRFTAVGNDIPRGTVLPFIQRLAAKYDPEGTFANLVPTGGVYPIVDQTNYQSNENFILLGPGIGVGTPYEKLGATSPSLLVAQKQVAKVPLNDGTGRLVSALFHAGVGNFAAVLDSAATMQVPTYQTADSDTGFQQWYDYQNGATDAAGNTKESLFALLSKLSPDEARERLNEAISGYSSTEFDADGAPIKIGEPLGSLPSKAPRDLQKRRIYDWIKYAYTLGAYVNTTTDPRQLAQIVNSVAPLGFSSLAALPTATASNANNQVFARLEQRRYDHTQDVNQFFADYLNKPWEFFLVATGTDAQNGRGNDDATFDYNTYGGIIGIDRLVGATAVVGASLQYDNATASLHYGGKVRMNGVRATGYFSKQFGDRFYVDAGVAAGYSSYKTHRKASGFAETEATPNSWEAGAFLRFGAVFAPPNLSDTLNFTPHIGIEYNRVSVAGFSESIRSSDSDFGIPVKVEDFSHDTLRGRAGVAASVFVRDRLGQWSIKFSLDASFSHDFLDNDAEFTSRLVADPFGFTKFNSTARVLPRDTLEISPAVAFPINQWVSFFGSYRYEHGFDGETAHNVNVGLRCRF